MGETGGTRVTARLEKHLGLTIAAATSLLVCVKLLAVAKWSSTTALGILAANGTANVLTGALLAALPVLYGYAYIVAMPRLEDFFRRRTPVERSSAALLQMWPTLLLLLITPAYLLAVILVLLAAIAVFKLWQRRRVKEKASSSTKVTDTVSRFEMTNVLLAGAVFMSYASLATPWLPAETAEVPGGAETVYVLRQTGNTVIVLTARDRRVEQLSPSVLTGEYCQTGPRWLTEPVSTLWVSPRYPSCPN